jgi:hypothetical protein
MKYLGRPNVPVAEVSYSPQPPRCVEYGVVHTLGKWFGAWLWAALAECISIRDLQDNAGKCRDCGFTAQQGGAQFILLPVVAGYGLVYGKWPYRQSP